jgi:twinkle protein
MPGIQIDTLPHNTATCATKKGLKVFAQEDGTINGFCFACQTFVADPYGDGRGVADLPKRKEKSAEDIQREVAEVESYQFLTIPSRKLRDTTLAKFDARVSVSEGDGETPTAIFWPVTKAGKKTGYHVKVLDKNCAPYNIGDTRDCDLLNWENAKSSGAYRLIITEGPEDMASVDRIYEMHGSDPSYHPAVASLPHGASSAKKVLTKHAEDIRRLFKEVVLCFDDDAAGHLAVEKAMQALPHAKSIKLPTKDANQALVEGKAKAAYNAMAFHAEAPKNTRIVTAGDIHEKAKEPATFGQLSWPWKQMNEDLRGIRLGETIYLGAATKMGKTTMKNAIGAHFIAEDKVKVFMAAPEEPNVMTYKLLANQLTGKIFHDPKVPFDDAAYEHAGSILKDKLYMLNLYQHLGWDSLKKDITAAVDMGVKAVFIDPVTSLSNGVNSGDANTLLQSFSQELAAMAEDMQFAAFIFCHLKAPEGQIAEDKRNTFYKQGHYIDLGNCSHEMGGSVYSSQFAGSRAMQRSCHLMLALLGNKDPDLPEETRNTREIRVLEDRMWGSSGKYQLFYNKNTGRFVEL